MQHSYRLTLCSGLLALAAASTANANDDYNAWYGGIDLVYGHASDSDISGSSSGKLSYKNDALWLTGLKIGYRPQALYTDRGAVRFEGELGGRSFGLDKLTSGGSTSNAPGELDVGALMANVYYDIHTNSSFTPYLGAGIGIAAAEFSKNPGLGITDQKAEDTMLAGQFMAGVSYTPEIWPSTSWDLGYRYFTAQGPEFKTGATSKVELDNISSNEVTVGFKYHF